ncbi:MAG: hypothetical protein AMJ65_01305 [Phycisphaerae bacterium SG8_4]|nr:MAG: hypothetical protein AMJ65_01305 [Phycisphaerae bacterium SG8_4]
MRDEFCPDRVLILALMCCLTLGSLCPAVNSKVVRHTSSSALLKGKTENVVIGSRGTIQLGRAAEALVVKSEDFTGVWSINSIVTSAETIYFGTSPNGGIYKYAAGELTKIYPLDDDEGQAEAAEQLSEIEQLVEEIVEAGEYLTNEHIFAMAIDAFGAPLAGISGRECKLCRFKDDKMEVIFEPDGAKYIFAIALDADGNIYLGTGPEGNIYKLDPRGKNASVVYKSQDKNILSVAIGQDGSIYAGSDGRGLVYKIDPGTESATVLYDSEQPEITALLIADSKKLNAERSTLNADNLYAAATSAKIVQTQTQFAASSRAGYSTGRTEAKAEEDKTSGENNGDLKLEVANTEKPTSAKPSSGPPPVSKGAKPGQASHIYEITKDGFVTDVFGEAVVFFCLVEQDDRLLAGTGNSAKLFSIDPVLEQQAVIYEDRQAAQITAIAAAGADAYLGTANPAKLVKLSSGFAAEGTYISDLIDADQPAKWGKLQLEADIPEGCQVLAASRSGNVKDVNDPTFSQWSEPVVVTGPIQLRCPLGRFCQYKLILQSRDGNDSPLIREIAVASTVPNRAPKVASVAVSRVATASKQGYFKISYVTKDVNGDKLIYKIDFRKLARTSWIELKDEFEATSFEWNARTVEDGRYEIRVTASDERSNTVTTRLLGSRVSEPVVVDNSGPVVTDIAATSVRDDRYKVFKIEVSDELSAIGKLDYTIDSNADWISAVPDDLVYDTTDEDFTVRVDKEKKLPPGDHVLTIRVSDAVGNTTYKTFDVSID